MAPSGARRPSTGDADATPAHRASDAAAGKGAKKLTIDVPGGVAEGGGGRGGLPRSQSAAAPSRKGRLKRSVSVKESANVTHSIPAAGQDAALGEDEQTVPSPVRLQTIMNLGMSVSKIGFGTVDAHQVRTGQQHAQMTKGEHRAGPLGMLGSRHAPLLVLPGISSPAWAHAGHQGQPTHVSYHAMCL